MTPWITLAATLAKEGLPALAERVRKQPATVAPALAEALGTPRTPSAIEAAIASDPLAIDKIAALDLELFEMEIADRQSARSAMAGNAYTGPIALMTLAGFFALTAALLFRDIPARNHDLLLVLFGSLATAGAGAVWAFFFGSSMGSKLKDAQSPKRKQ